MVGNNYRYLDNWFVTHQAELWVDGVQRKARQVSSGVLVVQQESLIQPSLRWIPCFVYHTSNLRYGMLRYHLNLRCMKHFIHLQQAYVIIHWLAALITNLAADSCVRQKSYLLFVLSGSSISLLVDPSVSPNIHKVPSQLMIVAIICKALRNSRPENTQTYLFLFADTQ